uniref:Ig-like domain-containing protein n=1 Tax=Varanus komodoensis TaxID=61221 RepID=A0A8D2J9F8_VARKO
PWMGRHIYSINVPHHVDVQRGLSARISCQFTYAPHDLYWGNEIYGYWFKFHETERHCLKPDSSCHQGHLMATNDYRQSVETSARDRFYLTGDPKQRSCSFLIVNAQLEDAGLYYFRVQAGWKLKYSYKASLATCTISRLLPNGSVSLVVSHLQKKEGDLEPVTVQEGDSVHLLCQASGNPDPVLTWRNQNKTFTESLPLAQVGLEAAGEYECQAVNSLGSAKITIQLLVQCKQWGKEVSVGCSVEGARPSSAECLNHSKHCSCILRVLLHSFREKRHILLQVCSQLQSTTGLRCRLLPPPSHGEGVPLGHLKGTRRHEVFMDSNPLPLMQLQPEKRNLNTKWFHYRAKKFREDCTEVWKNRASQPLNGM